LGFLWGVSVGCMIARIVIITFCSIFCLIPNYLNAENPSESLLSIFKPAPVTNISAFDTPNDPGEEIDITWDLSVDDDRTDGIITRYIILRADEPDREFIPIGIKPAHGDSYSNKETEDGKEYYYKVLAYPFAKFNAKLSEQFVSKALVRYDGEIVDCHK